MRQRLLQHPKFSRCCAAAELWNDVRRAAQLLVELGLIARRTCVLAMDDHGEARELRVNHRNRSSPHVPDAHTWAVLDLNCVTDLGVLHRAHTDCKLVTFDRLRAQVDFSSVVIICSSRLSRSLPSCLRKPEKVVGHFPGPGSGSAAIKKKSFSKESQSHLDGVGSPLPDQRQPSRPTKSTSPSHATIHDKHT
jgi:hypothetical protein